MTIGNSPLPYLRVRIVPRFPAIVQGANGTKVQKENGVYTIGPSTGDLMEVASVPDDAFVQVWDEQSGVYSRIPASAFVGGGGGGAVNSVNGKTGTVVLVASDIAGVGNMTAAVYDPTSKAGDAFDMANMVEGTTAKILTATERTKLSGVATGATANSSDATLLARANHTGTQSADTLTDGTTNKAFLATERTKLAGVATGATANTGTVTSVAVAVPSSMTTSGGPVTGAGTITLGHASGYQGFTATEASKLSGVASGATANDTDANLKARANHTGTQSADTLTDGTTNKAFLATERTKLSGVATGATANSADATLLARANHTGTQAASTITGLGAAATSNDYADLSNKPTSVPVAALSYPGGTTNFLRADGTFAAPPGGGSGGGDMYAAVYDPNGVADDAFDMDNMAEGTTAKIFTATERTKLSGVAAGATANDTDANLLARANHTGTQAISTVTSLQTTLDGKASTAAVTTSVNGLMIAADKVKLNGIATAATANSSDATLLARANHTGTQSADTLTDGTTNKAFLATERTKLSGVATGATANDTDANLKARANHTGTQAASTISDFSTAADARVAAAVGVSVQAYDVDLTTWAGVTPGTGVATFIATPSSANLAAAVTGETGSGALVFATSPTLVTPVLGAASATSLTLSTDLAIADGGTGASTASAAFTALKQDATTSATGVVELATAAEYRALTTGKNIDTDAVAGGLVPVALAISSGLVAWDMSAGIDFTLSASANFTLSNPTNPVVGKRGRIFITSGGAYTSALGSQLKTSGGAAATISQTNGSIDFWDYDCVSSTLTRILPSKDWK